MICPECGSENVEEREDCYKCLDCGHRFGEDEGEEAEQEEHEQGEERDEEEFQEQMEEEDEEDFDLIGPDLGM